AAGGELAASAIASALYPNKKPGELSPDEKEKISSLATLAGGLAAGLATDSTAGGIAGAQAGKNAVENNSLAGDKARKTVKESKEWWQAQIREKLGDGTTSQMINGALNAVGDTGDFVMAGGDYALDGAMALASCATGSNYCQTALNDVEGKNQAVAGSVKSLMNGESWQAIKETAKKASEGDQRALEAMGSILISVMTKKSPTLDKVPVVVSKTENSLPQWTAGEGKVSPKDQGVVTNVEHPTGKFDGKSLPYEKETIFADGIHFALEQKKHLTTFDGITNKGVYGTHNADLFIQAASENGIKILSQTPTSMKGITDISYQLPKKDRTGKIIEGEYKGGKPLTKTVYDPKVFSDQKMLELGQQAASSGYKQAISQGRREYKSTAGGVTFQVYLDQETGRVMNFFPAEK
ncbi:CdiA family toxin C-terminal domain-containing protein, partial [Photorhabdus aegyptia]